MAEQQQQMLAMQAPQPQQPSKPSEENLQDGSPVTDNYSPKGQ
jgi:hypothetical protein